MYNHKNFQNVIFKIMCGLISLQNSGLYFILWFKLHTST